MNEIANKFLLARDKFMPEMHLKQPGYTYSVCGQFTKNNERKSILRDKAFKIASDPEYDGYQRGLASMVYKFFDKNLVEVVLPLHLQINLPPHEIINLQINFINRLFETLRDEKFIYLLEEIFGVQI